MFREIVEYRQPDFLSRFDNIGILIWLDSHPHRIISDPLVCALHMHTNTFVGLNVKFGSL